MAAAIGVRGDYDTARLRELAKRSEDANQTRRLLALAAIYDGGSRTEAAQIVGVGLQTVRGWVLACNAEGPSGPPFGRQFESYLAQPLALRISGMITPVSPCWPIPALVAVSF